jgi:hypothetical protein
MEIEEYSKRVSRLLSNYKLYNRETFHKWFFGFTEDDADNITDERQYDAYKTVMNTLIKSSNPCADSNVYSGYTEKAMRTALSMRKTDEEEEDANPKKNNYDILFAIDPQIEIHLDDPAELILEKKSNAIVGVIVVEKGECMDRRKSWCVKVICVKPNSVKGTILMGVCLYCIKASPRIDQECLLELAGGYKNLSAFYSYTGLGFVRDDFLWDDRCFDSVRCMPMRADLSEISQGDIITKVLGRGPKFELDSDADPSGLWNRKCYALKNKNNEVLTEIQKISNKMLELSLWKKDEDTSSAQMPILQDKLTTKLEEFDRLTLGQPSCDDVNVELIDGVTSVPIKCLGPKCNILGGKSRKKMRGKKSRGKKSRGKKSRGKKSRGKKSRGKKYYKDK